MAYPTTLQDLDATRGASGQPLSNPNHITHHALEDATIEALEAKVGADASAVTTSHDYKLSEVTSTDKAVGKTATQDVTNKNLGTGTKVTLGSDATGDIYYRHSDGTLKRLAIGTANYILNVNSGVPAWREETAVADASVTVKGVVEEATLAEIDAGTGAGSTSARLFVNPSTLGKSVDGTLADNSDAKIPSQKAVKTYVDGNPATHMTGVATRAGNTASGDQTIAHGLGRTPKIVRINVLQVVPSTTDYPYRMSDSFGFYNGATQNCIYRFSGTSGATNCGANNTSSYVAYILSGAGGYQRATISVDATNITLTWTYNATLTADNIQIVWEVE